MKSELVGRLTELAEIRAHSKAEATKKADEHAARAQKIAEAESNYRARLDQEMARLERFNPVGPRAGVPLISGERLTREIEAGRPIWLARREHRARERAARHRQEQARELRREATPAAGPLLDADPAEGGQALDDEMTKRAKEELRAFRRELKAEENRNQGGKTRPPDSDRRRKLKKQRRKEKKRNKRDDAERDSNRAIAHPLTPRKAESSRALRLRSIAGLLLVAVLGNLFAVAVTWIPPLQVAGQPLATCAPFWAAFVVCFTSVAGSALRQRPQSSALTGKQFGGLKAPRSEARSLPGLFILLACICWTPAASLPDSPREEEDNVQHTTVLTWMALLSCFTLAAFCGALCGGAVKPPVHPRVRPTRPPSARVGGARKKVGFKLPQKASNSERVEVPFLGGPKAAKGHICNHFRTTEKNCFVKATIQLYLRFPQRYHGGSESEDPLFRTRDDKPSPRTAVTALIKKAARGLGLPEGDLGTHSLRFGGASAIWAQFQDSTMVKRWGRWSSDSFQTYIWEARNTAQGVAQKMATADLTPN